MSKENNYDGDVQRATPSDDELKRLGSQARIRAFNGAEHLLSAFGNTSEEADNFAKYLSCSSHVKRFLENQKASQERALKGTDEALYRLGENPPTIRSFKTINLISF